MLILGDCLEKMKEMADNSVDAIVTDPPYGWRFMGKAWDAPDIKKHADWAGDKEGKASAAGKYSQTHEANKSFQEWTHAWAIEAFRVLKPGGHALIFCGPRTYHRMCSGIEDAGFEIRDQIQWLYASGFPKSSRVNRSAAFCQCALNTHSKSNKVLSPYEGDRICMEDALVDDGLPQLDALHSTHKLEDFQADCPEYRDLNDERVQTCLTSDPKAFQLQECAPAHTHSVGREDVRASESLHSPSLAPRSDRPSNQDCSPRDFAEIDEGSHISESNKPADILQSSLNKQDNFQGLSYKNGLAECRDCGKPNADGFGTALKPANEPICLARKPLSEKTVALNVERWGTGAINIDASRIGANPGYSYPNGAGGNSFSVGAPKDGTRTNPVQSTQGRWPANLLLDEAAAALLNCAAAQDVARFFFVCGSDKIGAEDTFVGKKTENKNDASSIDIFGSRPSDQYLMGTISITKMETRSIMSFPIWNVSTSLYIGTCTIESEKITELLAESRLDGVSLANNTSAFLHLQGEVPVLIKGTVSLVLAVNPANGETQTVCTGTPTIASDESSLAISTIKSISKEIASALMLDVASDTSLKQNRFFYCAKASKSERNAGLEGMPQVVQGIGDERPSGQSMQRLDGREARSMANHHPTVKPIKLMRYLCRLITPPKGIVLDPFMGSGSTGIAAKQEGFDFIGIEMNEEYFEIAKKRISTVK